MEKHGHASEPTLQLMAVTLMWLMLASFERTGQPGFRKMILRT